MPIESTARHGRGADVDDRGDGDRLSRLEAALDAQQRQIDQLRAENQALRRDALVRSAPTSAEPSSATAGAEVAPGPLGRRSLLTKGLAAAGAATAGAIMVTADPAAAANNGPLLIAGNNFGTAATRLNVDAPGTDGGLQVIDSGGLPGLGGLKPALVVAASGVPLNKGIHVRSSGDGITVDASSVGVESTGAIGVIGRGSLGVVGISPNEVGTRGSGAIGVEAISTSGPGTTTGMALRAKGRNGVEVDASLVHLRLSNTAGNRTDPNEDGINHNRGDIVETSSGDLWLCTTAGFPGTWRKLAGPATAGAFHVLPAPARVYDSRPGFAPTSVGPKTPFAAGSTRVFDLRANGSGVPAGATAAMVTLLLVNAASGAGNLTIWANGATKPVANTLVWGGTAGRFAATAVTALDAQARVQVNASARTDLVIDVVGYYR